MLLINAFIQYLDISVSFPLPPSHLYCMLNRHTSHPLLVFQLTPCISVSQSLVRPFAGFVQCPCLVLASPEPVPQHCLCVTPVLWRHPWCSTYSSDLGQDWTVKQHQQQKNPCLVRFSGLWKTKAGNKILQKTFTKLNCTWYCTSHILWKGKRK